ncbi:unnamed protein product [Boreogadus saida]
MKASHRQGLLREQQTKVQKEELRLRLPLNHLYHWAQSSGAAGPPPKLWRGELSGGPATQLREYNPFLRLSCRTAAKLPPPELLDCCQSFPAGAAGSPAAPAGGTWWQSNSSGGGSLVAVQQLRRGELGSSQTAPAVGTWWQSGSSAP